MIAPGNPLRDERTVELAGTLVLAGKIAQAIETCEELLNRTHVPASDGPARLCLGQALLGAGHVQRALTELELVTRVPSLTRPERASALGWMSVCHIWLADLDAATIAAQEAADAASATGNHTVISVATTMIGVAARPAGT